MLIIDLIMRTKWGHPGNRKSRNTNQNVENSEIYAWISIVQLGGTLPRLITQPKVGLRQQKLSKPNSVGW